MTSLWLYLHFPQLQLNSLGVQQQALIIVDQQHKILQLSPLARQAGLQPGMSLGSAVALHRELEVVVHQPSVESNKLHEIAESLYLLTADISLQPPQGLLLRCHNMLRLYGDRAHYWQSIKNQLNNLRVDYHYAFAHSPLAAKALAMSHKQFICDDIRHSRQQVRQCRLEHSELSSKSREKFKRVGVHTLGQLLDIPLADIAKRFDAQLATYLGQLDGTFNYPVNFYHPAKLYQRSIELMYEVVNSQALLGPLKVLLDGLERFLRLRDEVTQQLLINLQQRDADNLQITIGSQQAEYQAQAWQKLSALKLETLQLSAPVVAISLTTGPTQIRTPDKLDLFAGKQGNLSSLQLIALLQVRLGEQAVFSPQLGNDWRPEQSNAVNAPLLTQSSPPPVNAYRPSLLAIPAQPLSEKVTIIHGPERLQTGWWDGPMQQRDYFIARSAQGQWCWIYKDASQRWFLHGLFS